MSGFSKSKFLHSLFLPPVTKTMEGSLSFFVQLCPSPSLLRGELIVLLSEYQ